MSDDGTVEFWGGPYDGARTALSLALLDRLPLPARAGVYVLERDVPPGALVPRWRYAWKSTPSRTT